MVHADNINYARLGAAQKIFEEFGFQNIETPWLVSPQAIDATIPPGFRSFDSLFGCLVGSAEQGFIQLMSDGQLTPDTCYQSTSPCFRQEDEYNELTRQTFMKLELHWYRPQEPRKAVQMMLRTVFDCYFEIAPEVERFDLIETPEGLDINLNGVEIGSFGVREWNGHVWAYGTGLAEPRFSLAMKLPPVVQPETVDLPGDLVVDGNEVI